MNRLQYVFFLFILYISFYSNVIGQEYYQPVNNDAEYQEHILKDMETRHTRDLENIEGKLKREKKKEYSKRYDTMVRKAESNHFITDKNVNAYFSEILYEIVRANPPLQNRNIRLLIGRYDWPNASCHGEGSIVINLGLISRLENESQLAFVLCHELAHDYMNHVNISIDEYVESIYSKEAQSKIKALKREVYNVYDQAKEMMKTISFDRRRHGRTHEVEADSMALVFMKPTRYDTREAIRTLELLDSIDVPKRPFLIDYNRHFDSDAFQVKNRWFEDSSQSAFGEIATSEEDKQMADSLKTHPDCQQRLHKLNDFSHNNGHSDPSNFKKYIRLADYEIVASSFQFGQYGKALFYSFLLLEENPEDAYLHTMVVDCLYELYRYQENHELGKVLDTPHDAYEENYNQFLNFLHNLRLRDLVKLGHFYAYKHGADYQENEEFRVAELYAASLIEKPSEWQSRKRSYLADFPKGYFRSSVQDFKPFAK